MTFEESYEKYIVLAEANGTTANLATDKSRYTLIYNTVQNKIIEWFIESSASDESRYLQSIKVKNAKLEQGREEDSYTSFKLPKNYFEFVGLEVHGSNGKCFNQHLKSREIKEENVDANRIDTNLNPTFKYRETFYTVAENAIQVYKDNFKIDKATLTYYRYPKQVSLESEDNPESPFKDDTLEFDDKLINRIIFLAVSMQGLASGDAKYQAFKQETIQKF